MQLPQYPKLENLIPVAIEDEEGFSFFLDRKSLSIGNDGVVRYAIVARSASGAENVSFEGIHCRAATYKIYATARGDGSWLRRDTEWREIWWSTGQRWRNTLRGTHFCGGNEPRAGLRDTFQQLQRDDWNQAH